MTRGREAESPSQLDAKALKDIALRVKDELIADQVSLIAGGVAFYGLLALFPAITAFVALAGLIVDPETILAQAESFATVLPEDAAQIIIGQMQEVAGSHEGGLGFAAFFGILFAIYSSSKAVDNMVRGLNVAYEEEEKRGIIQLKLTVLALTLAFLLGMIISLGIIAALPVFLAFLDGMPVLDTVVTWLRWPVLLLVGLGGIMVLYRYGPSRSKAQWKWLAPGAMIACILWILATVGFALYVRFFDTYNETFGALAGVVILMMWLWISSFILLLGAEIDAEMEAQTGRDTTTGMREPRGKRGAVKADQLGEFQT